MVLAHYVSASRDQAEEMSICRQEITLKERNGRRILRCRQIVRERSTSLRMIYVLITVYNAKLAYVRVPERRLDFA